MLLAILPLSVRQRTHLYVHVWLRDRHGPLTALRPVSRQWYNAAILEPPHSGLRTAET
jgi:hypothetical protein